MGTERTDDDDYLDRRDIDKKRFKIDATINIAHILTTLGMVYSLFNWGSGVNSALAVQETKIASVQADRERDRAETLQSLIEINRKLDNISREQRNK